MCTSSETAQIVNEVSHENIKMQLDTGALNINQESPATVVTDYSKILGHIHISEPNLVPIGDTKADA